MHIRPFTAQDTDAVIALWQTCQLTRPWNDPHKDIARKMRVQPELFLMGELNEQVIASAMAGYDGHRGSVFYLAVEPEFQQQGYGQKLMNHIEELLEGMGCPKVNIVVRTSNTEMLKFYESIGYSIDHVASVGKRLIADT